MLTRYEGFDCSPAKSAAKRKVVPLAGITFFYTPELPVRMPICPLVGFRRVRPGLSKNRDPCDLNPYSKTDSNVPMA